MSSHLSISTLSAPVNVELDLVARGAEEVGGHLGLLEPGHLPVVDVPGNKCSNNVGTTGPPRRCPGCCAFFTVDVTLHTLAL